MSVLASKGAENVCAPGVWNIESSSQQKAKTNTYSIKVERDGIAPAWYFTQIFFHLPLFGFRTAACRTDEESLWQGRFVGDDSSSSTPKSHPKKHRLESIKTPLSSNTDGLLIHSSDRVTMCIFGPYKNELNVGRREVSLPFRNFGFCLQWKYLFANKSEFLPQWTSLLSFLLSLTIVSFLLFIRVTFIIVPIKRPVDVLNVAREYTSLLFLNTHYVEGIYNIILCTAFSWTP